jgi:protein phosphatase 1L
MEDYVVAQFKPVDEHELGLFAIFDGHLSHDVPDYLRSHLFDNILKEVMHAVQRLVSFSLPIYMV